MNPHPPPPWGRQLNKMAAVCGSGDFIQLLMNVSQIHPTPHLNTNEDGSLEKIFSPQICTFYAEFFLYLMFYPSPWTEVLERMTILWRFGHLI